MLLVIAAAFAKGHRLNLVLLTVLIALYPLSSLRPLLGIT